MLRAGTTRCSHTLDKLQPGELRDVLKSQGHPTPPPGSTSHLWFSFFSLLTVLTGESPDTAHFADFPLLGHDGTLGSIRRVLETFLYSTVFFSTTGFEKALMMFDGRVETGIESTGTREYLLLITRLWLSSIFFWTTWFSLPVYDDVLLKDQFLLTGQQRSMMTSCNGQILKFYLHLFYFLRQIF